MVSASAATSPFASTVSFCRRLPFGDGGHDFHDAAHLIGQIGGHDVDRVGKIFPGSGNAGHVGLTAEFAFGSDFARHAGDFRGERPQLVDHRIDGVLQLENFALHVDRDFARQIAASHGRRDFGDVANLIREVARPSR